MCACEGGRGGGRVRVAPRREWEMQGVGACVGGRTVGLVVEEWLIAVA